MSRGQPLPPDPITAAANPTDRAHPGPCGPDQAGGACRAACSPPPPPPSPPARWRSSSSPRRSRPRPPSPPTDYCLGECADILPPGQNGNATLAGILLHRSVGTLPAHSRDQLDKYANLVYGYAGLREDQISTFFDDASFGVPANQVERSYSPRSDVTIVRDKAAGIPHVTGTTRSGTMFGAGYAGAEDRLFTMDLLRHVGRGTLTPFAGGAPGNRALEQSVWRNSPYTEADLQAQVTALRSKGSRGEQLYQDVASYIAGVNAYITRCMADRNCPGEYVLTGHLDAITNAGGPVPFTMTDLIAVAGVVGGLFGGGGGHEMESALVRIAARAKYGPTEGDRVWTAFRSQNDPETVLTLHDGQSFPYGSGSPDAAERGTPRRRLARGGTAWSTEPTGSARSNAATGSSELAAALSGLTIGAANRGMSNAAVVSGAHTTSGHPVAVFGPQTGYFAPQLLMVQELQGPGISARGAAFAGVNLYVLLGRGQDYAWSADLLHPRHHRHVRGGALHAGRQRAEPEQQPLPPPGRVPADGGAVAPQRLEPDHRRLHTRRVVQAGGVADRARAGRVARHGRRAAVRLHPAALHLPARGRLGDRVPDVQRPGRDGRRRRLPRLGGQRRVRLQLVLRQRRPVGLLHLRPQPGARGRRRTRTCR